MALLASDPSTFWLLHDTCLDAGADRIAHVLPRPDPEDPDAVTDHAGDIVAMAPRGVDILLPDTDDTLVVFLAAFEPDVIVVCGWPRPLPPALRARHGIVRLHPSLLPRGRGPHPISAALLAGDTRTGLTAIREDPRRPYTGPILARAAETVTPDDTHHSVTVRLRALIPDVLRDALDALAHSEDGMPQDSRAATEAPAPGREFDHVDWTRPARAIHDQVRAHCALGPVAELDGATVHIVRTSTTPAPDPARRVDCGDGEPLWITHIVPTTYAAPAHLADIAVDDKPHP